MVYEADQIKVLEDLEAVRVRPGMYIGSTGQSGLMHLIEEVVDNSIDEALDGHCSEIRVTVHTDNRVTVIDNGRGMPVGVHKETGINAVELVMTTLHAGGKFDHKSYHVSGGLHGVGISVVNALSEHLCVEVHRNGRLYRQEFSRGGKLTELEVVGESKGTGTTVTFLPDAEIFSEIRYNFSKLSHRLKELSYLNGGLLIILNNEAAGISRRFQAKGGIISFVKELCANKEPLHPKPIYISGKEAGTTVEIAMQFTSGYDESIFAFANNINTVDGGTHLTGFKGSLTKFLNDYGREKKILRKDDPNLRGDDIREGLVAIISLKLPNPEFEGQTKTKLGNPEVASLVTSIVQEELSLYFGKNPRVARTIIEKSISSGRARMAAAKARKMARRKGPLFSTTLPGKLADCSTSDPAKSELYIVEGPSAGGCFCGDTKVTLADGRRLNFTEIIEEQKQGIEHFCYTIRRDGKIGLEKITDPRLTRKNAEVVKVILDNGEEIICTPDHQFMLRDGGYKQAKDLIPSDSLMPLRTKLSDISEPGITIQGYEMAWDPKSESWLFTHILADWHNLWKGIYGKSAGNHRHHIDFNRHNNNPTNIIRLDADKHLALHREHVEKTLHRPETVEKCRQIKRSEAYRAMMSERMKRPETREILSAQAREQWEDEEYKQYMVEKWLEFYNTNKEYREEVLERLNQVQQEYWGQEENRKAQAERVKRYFAEDPQAREELSKQAKEQWQDEELLAWRAGKTREQWQDPGYRRHHSVRVRQWWQEHPEHGEKLATAARRTWADPEKRNRILRALSEWRDSTPSEEKRHLICEGHRLKALQLLNAVLEAADVREAYERLRLEEAPTALRYERLLQEHFEGDEEWMHEAAANLNCKVVAVRRLAERRDVYDITVGHSHNFALAAGVFVHNSAKQGRDRTFQAILPLRGKVLNVEKARLTKLLDNAELKSIITAVGTGIREEFTPEKLRYHKLIIMADADVDGAHICTLLLTFFYRYLRTLIENGYVYIAKPPLYQVKEGKKTLYLYTDEELERFRAENDGRFSLKRFKGLGEMNPKELWETTMNPERRILKKVEIRDALEADEIFSTLMGNDVALRRDFIWENSDKITALDI